MTGGMRAWTVIPRLHLINVPTLVWNGEFDTSADWSVSPFFELIPHCRWVTLPGASHGAISDSPEMRKRVMKMIGDFMNQGIPTMSHDGATTLLAE